MTTSSPDTAADLAARESVTRYEALALAVQLHRDQPPHPSDVVETAEQFYRFLGRASSTPAALGEGLMGAIVDLGEPGSTTPATLADFREWLARCEAAGVPAAAIPVVRSGEDTPTAPAWLYALRVTG